MTSTSTQFQPSENSCRSSLEPIKQVRPKLPLLKVLHAAGAKGETFTLKECMIYLGEYIAQKQLYDREQQHMVHCGKDQLGELLGCQSFSVKEPSLVYDMLRRNVTLTSTTDAAQTLAFAKDQSEDNPSQDRLKQNNTESSFSTEQEDHEGDLASLTALKHTCKEKKDGELIDNLSKEQTTLDLLVEEWDVAGLPWWFLGNLRNNYKSRSNDSTDIHTNKDVDTAVVSDTTDDLWFLNEITSDNFNVTVPSKIVDCEQVNEERKEDNKVMSETASSDDLEDSQFLSDDTDTDVPSEQDSWQCIKCKKFNSPIKRYCFRCWALRKDWFSDCPKLIQSLSTSNIASMHGEEDLKGIDVPDCRRTISAPIVRPKDLCSSVVKPNLSSKSSMDSLDLALGCKDKETSLRFVKCTEKEVQPLENSKELLKPCLVCLKRPRNGNIVHGRTAHLVACFTCAKRLKKGRSVCPVCKKQIQMVIKTFIT
ncbi:protein Mdm4 isoform X1 [Pantherophis guttatus]|uniref:Protein Mdm4 n=1 Tax=Pantherophis guttatus TaxID=94885 RepID=A0A6P9BJX5_PANGU|nr:protein Mdm4 isoform X1 [Pantherophis guttatus]XP_060545759.1 protein Mdm4 isoform X1 [Pantherophis guttatus]